MLVPQIGQPVFTPAAAATSLTLDTSKPASKVRLAGPIALTLTPGNYGGQPFNLNVCEPTISYPVTVAPSSSTVPVLPAGACTALLMHWDSDANTWMVPPLSVGTPGINGTNGLAGAPGALFFGPSGALSNVKCWIGAVTSTTSGQWSANISSAGLTTLVSLQVNAKSTGTTAATTYQPSTVVVMPTLVSGVVYGYTTSVVGIIPLTQATAATTVMVEACGT